MYVQISILFDSKHMIIFLSISLNIYVLDALKNHINEMVLGMHTTYAPGRVEQSLMCLTADPGVKSLILAQSHTFGEIGHEIISTSFSVTSESMCRKYWLLAQEKKCG